MLRAGLVKGDVQLDARPELNRNVDAKEGYLLRAYNALFVCGDANRVWQPHHRRLYDLHLYEDGKPRLLGRADGVVPVGFAVLSFPPVKLPRGIDGYRRFVVRRPGPVAVQETADLEVEMGNARVAILDCAKISSNRNVLTYGGRLSRRNSQQLRVLVNVDVLGDEAVGLMMNELAIIPLLNQNE